MDEIEIGTLEKSATQDLWVKLSTYQGRRYLDVRTYLTLDATGERVPTKKGITLAPEKIGELIAVLRRAEAEAISQGLLKPESRAA